MLNHDSRKDSAYYYAKAFQGLMSEAKENGIATGFRLSGNSGGDIRKIELNFSDKNTGECEYVKVYEKESKN